MTDGEVDDRSTMVRFLLYSSDFDIAGIVEENSLFQQNGHSSESWLEDELDAYEAVYPNLIVHNPDYPTPDYLRKVSAIGNETRTDLILAPDKMTTKDLTPGVEYEIQFFVNDYRTDRIGTSPNPNLTTIVRDQGGEVSVRHNAAGVDGSTGQYVTGRFVATDTTKVIQLVGGPGKGAATSAPRSSTPTSCVKLGLTCRSPRNAWGGKSW